MTVTNYFENEGDSACNVVGEIRGGEKPDEVVILGVLYVNERTQIGTDHLSFERAGVPGFAFFQDAVDYRERTHHSQTDTLDKIIPDDLEEGAITMAVMAYAVAQLPGMLPRKEQAAATGSR
jgi:hypothetical protein